MDGKQKCLNHVVFFKHAGNEEKENKQTSMEIYNDFLGKKYGHNDFFGKAR